MNETLQRITALHEWYCQNVMRVRLTPEIERLWLEWLTAGYNGPQLRGVIIYLRKQISAGKRNDGALKLSNIFERAEDGSFRKFDEDLGLSTSLANRSIDKRLAPAPGGGGSVVSGQWSVGRKAGDGGQRVEDGPIANPEAAKTAFEKFIKLKEKL